MHERFAKGSGEVAIFDGSTLESTTKDMFEDAIIVSR